MLGSRALLRVQIIMNWCCFNGLCVQPEAEIRPGGFFCPVCVNLIEEVAVTLHIPFILLMVHKRLLSE